MFKPSEALKFKRQPFQHVLDELDYSWNMPHRGLFWEMGTMKTDTMIQWIRVKYNIEKEILPTLILAPPKTLPGWRREFFESAPDVVANAVGIAYEKGMSQEQRVKIIENSKIILANYEVLNPKMKKVRDALRARGIKVLACDEADNLKAWDGKRVEQLIPIADQCKYVVIATGTPWLKNYMDLWSQMRILDGGLTFGTNFFSQFRNKYFVDKNEKWTGPGRFPNWQPIEGLEEIIAGKIAKICSRRTKEETLPFLPKKTYETLAVELSPEQEKAYNEMDKEFIAEVAGGVCAASNALTKALRMSQILYGYMPLDTGYTQRFKNPRLDLLEEILADRPKGSKTIIWTVYSQTYQDIFELLKKMGRKYAHCTGETQSWDEERNKFLNDPECVDMVANPAAGGAGINEMIGADLAIYYSRNNNLRQRLQSEDRIHRKGSEIHDKITIVDLIAYGTYDEVIFSSLKAKEEDASNFLRRIKELHGLV